MAAVTEEAVKVVEDLTEVPDGQTTEEATTTTGEDPTNRMGIRQQK